MEKTESTLKSAEGNGFEFHTTLTREIRPIRDLPEWFERWQAAATLEEMLGLLHVGFNMLIRQKSWEEKRGYDRIDLLTFYFTIADGWADSDLLELSGDSGKRYRIRRDSSGDTIEKRPSEVREILAQKAFSMLCLNYFSKVELLVKGLRDEFSEIWTTITSERFFPVIQNFFRIQRRQFSDDLEIRNLYRRRDENRSHSERVTVEFIVNLAKFLWGWKGPDFTDYKNPSDKLKERIDFFATMRERINAAKPWMIDVIAHLNRLDILKDRTLELDKACLARLKEIALRSRLDEFHHHVTKSRQVTTLDEARYVGSEAAWLLEKYRIMTEQYKRLTGIRDAEQQIRDAGRKIKKLTT